ncbi:MAG: helix-turn-helix domain-containing protein [Coprobacillaceae bacterium]
MHAWESIQTTLDYIDANYDTEITIKELADKAHLSMFYYQRLFNRLVGKTVFEYIKLRRLAKALPKIKDSKDKILDIALSCGFNSHETFSKIFKEVYGITPTTYRNHIYHLDYVSKPNLLLNYTMVDENVPLICDDIILEVRRYTLEDTCLFIGIKERNPIDQINQPKINTLANLWDTMLLEIDSLKQQATIGVGADILLPSEDPMYFDYISGFESSDLIDTYDSWYMPEGEYIVCTFEAEDFSTLVNETLYKASQYLFEVWLPKHNIKIEPFIVQKYYNPEQEGCYIETWVKVV